MDGRCRALLAFLASEPWREDAVAGVPVTSDEVSLAGRTVDIPKNCHASKQDEDDAKGALIWCDGELALFWSSGSNPKLAREPFLAGAHGKRSTIPCSLDSVAARCDLVTDGLSSVYRAEAKVRSSDVVALCMAPGGKVPAVCNSVLSLPPGK